MALRMHQVSGCVFDRSLPAAAGRRVRRGTRSGGRRTAVGDRRLLLHSGYLARRDGARTHGPTPGRPWHPAARGGSATPRSRRWRLRRWPSSHQGDCLPASGTACRTGWNRWVPAHPSPLTTLDEVITTVRRLLQRRDRHVRRQRSDDARRGARSGTDSGTAGTGPACAGQSRWHSPAESPTAWCWRKARAPPTCDSQSSGPDHPTGFRTSVFSARVPHPQPQVGPSRDEPVRRRATQPT